MNVKRLNKNKLTAEFFNSNKFLVSVLITATLLIYSQSFFHGLIFLDDDFLVYERFQATSLGSKISESFTSNYLDGHYYRPVTLLSFAIESELGGDSPILYHSTNILIHILIVMIIFTLLKRIGYSGITSFIASLFFAVSPININAVGWIAGRGDLLSAFFVLTGFLFFQKFVNKNKLWYLLIVIIALLLAILSKEAALTAVFLFTAFIFIERKDWSFNKTNIVSILLIPFILFSYFLLRSWITEVHIDKFSFSTFSKNIFVLPETISKFFIPIEIKALPKTELFTSISGTIILFILIALPFILKKINRLRYYFGLGWFVLLLFPGMVSRTMMQDGYFYWDCRSYLPLIGLSILIAELLQLLQTRFELRWVQIVIGIFLLVLGISTAYYVRIYKNPPTYWNSVKSDYPDKFLPYVGLYNYYNYINDPVNAEEQLLSAIKIKPKEFSTRQLLINFYLRRKENEKAFDILKDTLYKKINGSKSLLDRFISVSNELNNNEAISDLIALYKDDPDILEKIKEIINRKDL